MKFTIAATALLLAKCAASKDDEFATKEITSLRGKSPPQGNRKGLQRKLRPKNRTVDKLLRKLAKKKQMQSESNTATDPNLDLGVIGTEKQEEGNRRRMQIEGRQDILESDNGEVLEYSTLLLPTLSYLCQEFGEYCECGSFDFGTTNGTISCRYYEEEDGSPYCQSTINSCGESVEICQSETIVLEAFDPDTYTYTACSTYTKPYQQHVCITLDAMEDGPEIPDTNATVVEDGAGTFSFESLPSFPCSVSFNDMECNSCSTELRVFNQLVGDDIIGTYQERCFEIDCSNTGDEFNILNTCDGKIFPSTLKDTVVFGDDCERCQPCGIGFTMSNPDAEGIFPVVGEYQCSGLELAAKIGFFDREICPEVQAQTTKYCGCEPVFYDEALVRNIRTVPTKGVGYTFDVVLPGDTVGSEACDVCGSSFATVALPGAVVTLPNKDIQTSCAALQGSGVVGLFSSDYCRREVMPLVFRYCGGCFFSEPPVPATADSILDQSYDRKIKPEESIHNKAPEEEDVDSVALEEEEEIEEVEEVEDVEDVEEFVATTPAEGQRQIQPESELHNEKPEELERKTKIQPNTESHNEKPQELDVDSDGNLIIEESLPPILPIASVTEINSGALSPVSQKTTLLAAAMAIPCALAVYFS
jgi:hypothetical protein